MRVLDRRIDIERFTAAQDGTGQQIEDWEKVVANRPAAYRPISGTERYTAEQLSLIHI